MVPSLLPITLAAAFKYSQGQTSHPDAGLLRPWFQSDSINIYSVLHSEQTQTRQVSSNVKGDKVEAWQGKPEDTELAMTQPRLTVWFCLPQESSFPL